MALVKKMIPVFFACLLAGCGAVFVNEGSKNAYLAEGLRNPDKPAKPSLSRASRLVGDFEDGTTNLNPHLFGSPDGGWVATMGTNLINAFIASDGANGTKLAAHLSGLLTDPGDFTYPVAGLQGRFHAAGANYDASLFSGIRFYYRVGSGDKAHRRRFSIAIAPTTPTSEGGNCLDQCGNHFGVNLPLVDGWTKYDYKFGDFAREQGWGSNITPPGLADHLQELIYLKWEHGANNIKGTFQMDYWVDEVEFF